MRAGSSSRSTQPHHVFPTHPTPPLGPRPQVRQLGARQHMVQQQLVAAMAARERRHAEAQALAAEKEGLQALLADAAARQRALHQQVRAGR